MTVSVFRRAGHAAPERIELRGLVVVVLGASSGIGRASALALADHGRRLVLVARGRGPLDEVAEQCRAVATWSGRLIERRRTPAPSTSGALFSAPTHGSMSGGWRLVPWRRELGDRVGRALARR